MPIDGTEIRKSGDKFCCYICGLGLMTRSSVKSHMRNIHKIVHIDEVSKEMYAFIPHLVPML